MAHIYHTLVYCYESNEIDKEQTLVDKTHANKGRSLRTHCLMTIRSSLKHSKQCDSHKGIAFAEEVRSACYLARDSIQHHDHCGTASTLIKDHLQC